MRATANFFKILFGAIIEARMKRAEYIRTGKYYV